MKVWKLISIALRLSNRFLINLLLFFFLVLPFLSNCSQKLLFRKNPKTQIFIDQTHKSFRKIPAGIQTALFASINGDFRKDLVLVSQGRNQRNKIKILLNRGRGKFLPHRESGLNQDWGMRINYIAINDLNGDKANDLILLGSSGTKTHARLLLNNKKGYFYSKGVPLLPSVHNGVERVDLADFDGDGNLDLFFTGRSLGNSKGELAVNQAQLMINDGRGNFRDVSFILLPVIKEGVVGTSIADYDGDDVLDIFLVNGKGSNAILINNGLGKFSDISQFSLPRINAKSTSADWADFDLDGDNDLLIATSNIDPKNRDFLKEFSFFLENDGKGRFVKRSMRLLPNFPSHKVYLLDANGNSFPDIIILSHRGAHFLVSGGSNWKFYDETVRRFPYLGPFDEMTFGNVSEKGYLDLFAVTSKGKKGQLWINHFE